MEVGGERMLEVTVQLQISTLPVKYWGYLKSWIILLVARQLSSKPLLTFQIRSPEKDKKRLN